MNGTKPTLVVVTEKPSSVRALAPHLSRHWPQHRVLAVMTLYLGLYEFRYPHGLSATDYPFVAVPRWKPRSVERPVREIHGGEVPPTPPLLMPDLEPQRALQMADQIVFAADPDAAGAVAFHVLVEQALGAPAAALERPAIFLQTFAPEDIGRAVEALGSTADPRFQAWLRAGQARRFFDYNFNVNALNLLGDVLRRTSDYAKQATYPPIGMSKYGLQLLYFLRGKSFDDTASVLRAMQHWQGTGRYPSGAQLGSAASQSQIMMNLALLGLISCPPNYRPMKRQDVLDCRLTDAGIAFLDRLHPDCEDADLPFRLRQWEAEWPASRPAMERYLRTFFGKQKRYARLLIRHPKD